MRLLVIGGTLFVGRHFVEAALARGHEVSLFNRGRRGPELFPGAEKLLGDRDDDLSALHGREFDAVFDPSAYKPPQVSAVLAALDGRVGHYTFISSISAYGTFPPGRAAVVRPGLIVGPHDPTDRFTYWPREGRSARCSSSTPATLPSGACAWRRRAGRGASTPRARRRR